MGPCGYASAGKLKEPLPLSFRTTVATVESEPKPSPCFQHLTVTLLKHAAARVIVVLPFTPEQYTGETTDIWQPRISSIPFSESTLRESKERSLSTGDNLCLSAG